MKTQDDEFLWIPDKAHKALKYIILFGVILVLIYISFNL